MRVFAKSIRGMALAIVMLCLLSGLGVCVTTVIDFENVQDLFNKNSEALGLPPNNNEYHTVYWAWLDNYYLNNYGVKFNHVTLIDFSQGDAIIGNIAHSGTVAIEKGNYRGMFGNPSPGNCDPIEISLPQVYRIKVWVGIDLRKIEQAKNAVIKDKQGYNFVTMSAYNDRGGLEKQVSATIIQTQAVVPDYNGYQYFLSPALINTPLEIKSDYPITKVIISFDNGCNAALAIDDVEFDTPDMQPYSSYPPSYAGGNPYPSPSKYGNGPYRQPYHGHSQM